MWDEGTHVVINLDLISGTKCEENFDRFQNIDHSPLGFFSICKA